MLIEPEPPLFHEIGGQFKLGLKIEPSKLDKITVKEIAASVTVRIGMGNMLGNMMDNTMSNMALCPKCSSPLVLRTRKKDGGQFFGCSKFPKCRGVKKETEININ